MKYLDQTARDCSFFGASSGPPSTDTNKSGFNLSFFLHDVSNFYKFTISLKSSMCEEALLLSCFALHIEINAGPLYPISFSLFCRQDAYTDGISL